MFFSLKRLDIPNQPGFKSEDSCIKQLLSIAHEIYETFDNGWEVRGFFLDISMAFDKVWHQNVTLKLKQNVISGTY